MILADSGPPLNIYNSSASTLDFNSATLRMARLYYDRYQPLVQNLLDWSNVQGRTALHLAAIKGNEDLVRVGIHGFLREDQSNLTLIRCFASSELI
jgi:hypothetical protein